MPKIPSTHAHYTLVLDELCFYSVHFRISRTLYSAPFGVAYIVSLILNLYSPHRVVVLPQDRFAVRIPGVIRARSADSDGNC